MKQRKFLLCITFALIVTFGLTSGVLATTPEGGTPNLSTSLVPSAVEPKVTMTDLGTLGGATSYGNGINNRGQIVGWTFINAVPDRAFLWEDGAMADVLGTGGAFYDINDRGQIVGWHDTGSGQNHALLWEHGALTDLGTLGGNSIAERINDGGQIVGGSRTSSGPWHAVLWTVKTPGQ